MSIASTVLITLSTLYPFGVKKLLLPSNPKFSRSDKVEKNDFFEASTILVLLQKTITPLLFTLIFSDSILLLIFDVHLTTDASAVNVTTDPNASITIINFFINSHFLMNDLCPKGTANHIYMSVVY